MRAVLADRPGAPATIPGALLQADAIGADCLSLYGSRLTGLASMAGTDLANLTSHVGNGFGQTPCDLLSPPLLNQWYVITQFGMGPGDASLIDNVAMSSGVNQTGGSDCQYAWEPGTSWRRARSMPGRSASHRRSPWWSSPRAAPASRSPAPD
jgi:hypothetical protein